MELLGVSKKWNNVTLQLEEAPEVSFFIHLIRQARKESPGENAQGHRATASTRRGSQVGSVHLTALHHLMMSEGTTSG